MKRLKFLVHGIVLTRPQDYWLLANSLAFASFCLAAVLLFGLERLAWRYSIDPHIALVERMPVTASVLRHHIVPVGTGPQGSVFPTIIYRYEVKGRSFESSVVRPSQFVNDNGEEGGIRFDGPDRHENVRKLLDQFPVGQSVTAWIDPEDPAKAMLVQQLPSVVPFFWGILTALFVPIVWLLFVGTVKAIVLRPRGRWLAMGWSVLTFASAYPVVWQFQQLSKNTESGAISRLLNVWLSVAIVVFIGSLMPRVIRSGLAVGIILSFAVVGGLGTAVAAALGLRKGILGWKADTFDIFARCMEYALISGIALGMLLAIAAWRGIIWIQSDEDFDPRGNVMGRGT